MENRFWEMAALKAGGLLCCATLAGCGALSVTQEAKRYRTEQAMQVEQALTDCRAGRPHGAGWNHAGPGAASPDCFVALVSAPTRRVDGAVPEAGDGQALQIMSARALGQAQTASDLVDQVAWMALLTKMAYRRFVDPTKRSFKDACTYRMDLHPLSRLNAVAQAADHWELWQPERMGCRAEGGLFYETYVYRGPAGKITQAVIVFRGTENYSGQLVDDWSANLASAFNSVPGQFKEVERQLPQLIAALQEAGGSTLPVYTAGHSLGGGLAQFAAYLHPGVRAAYTFNTSPVTGWTWLRTRQRLHPEVMPVQDPQIIRVTQDNEALGWVRTYSNAANSTVRRFGRTDVIFDFPASRAVLKATDRAEGLGGAVDLHSITLLACNLAARVATRTAPAAFDFKPVMARAAISEGDGHDVEAGALETEGLCQVKGKTADCAIDWIAGSAVCR